MVTAGRTAVTEVKAAVNTVTGEEVAVKCVTMKDLPGKHTLYPNQSMPCLWTSPMSVALSTPINPMPMGLSISINPMPMALSTSVNPMPVALSTTNNTALLVTFNRPTHTAASQRSHVPGDAAIAREVELMRRLAHPNVLRLIDYQSVRNEHRIVLELASGGDLFGARISLFVVCLLCLFAYIFISWCLCLACFICLTLSLSFVTQCFFTCTCCYDLTKGTQDKDFSYSFSILSLSCGFNSRSPAYHSCTSITQRIAPESSWCLRTAVSPCDGGTQ